MSESGLDPLQIKTTVPEWLMTGGLALLALVAPLMLVSTLLLPPTGPPDPDERLRWVTTALVVLIFWSFTLVVLIRRYQQPVIRLLYVHGQVLAITMVYPLSQPSPWGQDPPGLLWLSIMGFYFLAPLTLHLNITFPVYLGSPSQRRVALGLAYLLALVAVWTWKSGSEPLRRAGELYSIGILQLSVAVMVYAYLFRATPDSRRRLRLIWLGTFLAIILSNLLFFIPGLYGWPVQMPVWVVGLLLVLVPVSYVYAITRQNLFGIDRLLNRSLVYFLLLGGITCVNLLLLIGLYRLLPGVWLIQALVSALLTLLFGWNFAWLRSHIQRLVDRIFYGGTYDYPGVVDRVSHALVRSLDRQQARQVLTHQVPAMMLLQEGELWIGEAPPAVANPGLAPCLDFSFNLQDGKTAVWRVAGRRDGEDFSQQDLRILKTLAQQAEIALDNIVLIEAYREQIDEIRRSRAALTAIQRQMMRSREDERARLARDLHDGPVQLLIGINLQLGMLLAGTEDFGWGNATSPGLQPALVEMRQEVKALLAELRKVCVELRPPMLDMIGLGAALRSLAGDWGAHTSAQVELELPPDGDLRGLSDEVAVNFYRVTQEALTNIHRHAGAERVSISLRGNSACLELLIQDDGCGFNAARALSQAASAGHFGLIGMRERVEWIGAEWDLHSSPGQGTSLRLIWPKSASP